jgi:hypothetical protein
MRRLLPKFLSVLFLHPVSALKLSLVIVLLTNICTAAQKVQILVTSVSHEVIEHVYTTLSPQTESSSCGVYKRTAYCSGSTMPAHYNAYAWYEFTEVVTAPDPVRPNQLIRYTLRRVAKTRHDKMDTLADGLCCFVAEIKGKRMHIKSRRYGNQGKEITTKWDIVDVQQIWKQLPKQEESEY